MQLVPDTSVAMKWLVSEKGSEAATDLLHGGDQLHVPGLIAVELANALWSKVRSGLLAPDVAPALLEWALALHLEWTPDQYLSAHALRIAVGLNNPVYDYVFLALAYRIDGVLVTADARFVNTLAATEHADRVILLENFAAAQG